MKFLVCVSHPHCRTETMYTPLTLADLVCARILSNKLSLSRFPCSNSCLWFSNRFAMVAFICREWDPVFVKERAWSDNAEVRADDSKSDSWSPSRWLTRSSEFLRSSGPYGWRPISAPSSSEGGRPWNSKPSGEGGSHSGGGLCLRRMERRFSIHCGLGWRNLIGSFDLGAPLLLGSRISKIADSLCKFGSAVMPSSKRFRNWQRAEVICFRRVSLATRWQSWGRR